MDSLANKLRTLAALLEVETKGLSGAHTNTILDAANAVEAIEANNAFLATAVAAHGQTLLARTSSPSIQLEQVYAILDAFSRSLRGFKVGTPIVMKQAQAKVESTKSTLAERIANKGKK